MTFHDTFWVVTGTAAPVIALAAVVSSGEFAREYDRHWKAIGGWLPPKELKKETDVLPLETAVVSTARVWTARMLGWCAIVQSLNVCLQTALLTVSLLSIADQANVVPPWLAVTFAVVGLAVLGLTGILTAVVRGGLSYLSSPRTLAYYLGIRIEDQEHGGS